MKDADVPVLFSAVEQWKPKKFMTLLDFINTLSPTEMPLFDSLAKDAVQQKF